MYPLNDNDLDRLSREAAEQYDVDKNPSTSGWEALEGKLNKEMPVDEKKRRRFLFWLFFIAATAGGGLWYIMSGSNTAAGRIAHVATVPTSTNNNDAKNTPLPAAPVSPNPVKLEEEDQPVVNGKTATATSPQTNPQPDRTGTTENNKREENKTAPVSTAQQQKEKQQASSLVLTHTKAIRTGSRDNKLINKKNNSKAQLATKDKTQAAPLDNKSNIDKADNVAEDKQPITTNAVVQNDNNSNQTDTATVAKTTAPQPAAKSVKDTTAVAQAKQPAKKTDNKKVKGLEIGLVGGPDASNVKFYNAGRVGFNVGLQLGYRFSDRWSVNTGAVYTKKNYLANGKDVTLYGYMAQPGVKLNTMEGYCSMWDFPINVRYDFSVNNKRRFFASTGLSTYIMNRENYDYYYTYNNSPERTYNWDSKERGVGDTTYLFSILNLSVGFERMINKKFSVQAEPYFKLPLSQLGHGKLNLNSYGIYFSVRYRITK